MTAVRLPAHLVERLRPRYADTTVCLTGGCGFIGSHLADALLSLGASLRVIDDLSNSSAEHIASLLDMEPERVRFVRGSILEDAALAEAISGSRVVFHLAAMGSVPRSIEEPRRAWAVNATGSLRVLEAARAAGVERVVYSASSSAYGNGPELPKTESLPPRPASPYAAGKLAGEALCRAWAESYGIDTVSLRYFNIFGPRQPADSAYAAVIPAFASRLLAGLPPVIFGDGSQSRDFTHVANAVLANLLAGAIETPLGGEVVNIGAGERTSVRTLAERLAGLLAPSPIGAEFAPARAGDVQHSQADLTRARTLLGYEPTVPLTEGLAATAEWFRGTQGQLREPHRPTHSDSEQHRP